MKPAKHVFWELILIISSVLIFRSLWLLMDTVEVLNAERTLWITLIIGMVVGGYSYKRLTHAD